MKKLPLLSLLLFCHLTANADFQVDNLKVEYNRTPLGIDEKTPRFSWLMLTSPEERGAWQTAYQIMVRDPEGTFVWDTQKMPGNRSVGITYSGKPLNPCTRYLWTVIVWNQKGKSASNTSWFETGLMNPDPGLSAWDGAKWIGGNPGQLVFQSHYLSVFRVKYTLTLDRESESTKASFILGANDNRLLDKNKNIWNIESDINASFIKFEFDISSVDGSDSGLAKLNIYRVGRGDDYIAFPLLADIGFSDERDKQLLFRMLLSKITVNHQIFCLEKPLKCLFMKGSLQALLMIPEKDFW